jgi:hypothetical protein
MEKLDGSKETCKGAVAASRGDILDKNEVYDGATDVHV